MSVPIFARHPCLEEADPKGRHIYKTAEQWREEGYHPKSIRYRIWLRPNRESRSLKAYYSKDGVHCIMTDWINSQLERVLGNRIEALTEFLKENKEQVRSGFGTPYLFCILMTENVSSCTVDSEDAETLSSYLCNFVFDGQEKDIWFGDAEKETVMLAKYRIPERDWHPRIKKQLKHEIMQDKNKHKGCGYEFPHFGADYPDACCIDGYLWDMDSYDEAAGGYTIGGDDPCPFCNTEEWLESVVDEDFSREKALRWLENARLKYGSLIGCIKRRADAYERAEVKKADVLGSCDLPRPAASYTKGATDQNQRALNAFCSMCRNPHRGDCRGIGQYCQEKRKFDQLMNK